MMLATTASMFGRVERLRVSSSPATPAGDNHRSNVHCCLRPLRRQSECHHSVWGAGVPVARAHLTTSSRRRVVVMRQPAGATPVSSLSVVSGPDDPDLLSPVLSVNYHISRTCNYSCGFCFHTAKNGYVLSLEEAKRGLALLREKGTQKINFAGGEPFIHPELLGDLTRFCKLELDMATSVISNGSLIRADWMERYGPYLDILGLSVDSFSEETNKAIGRGTGAHLANVYLVRGMCEALGIKFKVNTVVNALNHQEDMNDHISLLQPSRWKVFQVLLLDGENTSQMDGVSSLRDAVPLAVSDAEFGAFLDRHAQQPQLVPEPNDLMQSSYLLLDEKMRFLDCSTGSKVPGESILDVGVERALVQAGFDFQAFVDRGGIYQWNK